MIRSLPVFFFVLCWSSLFAQWDDTDCLTPEFHKGRRDALRELLPEKSVAVFFSNPVRNRSNDVDFQFSQDPDFYYLSGHVEPNAVLVIFKESRIISGLECNEIIFVEKRDSASELWTGKKLGAEGVRNRLGFNLAFEGEDWKGFGIPWGEFKEVFTRYTDDPGPGKRNAAELKSLIRDFSLNLAEAKVRPNQSGIGTLMARLREIKLQEERVLMQKAVDITVEGFLDMIGRIGPGMKEYEAQAIVEYHARKNGSEYMGYPSICGAGQNASVLHYTFNRKMLVDGELLLVDMGAEYHGYTADITRTVPVNGRFSEEQRQIYNLVLEAQSAGVEKCRPMQPFRAAHKAAADVIAKGLLKLGIISSESGSGRYFMHGTSHYLGLDVHDAGTYTLLKPGVVMTVEPGIYIPEGSPCDPKWWNISVRIEDDVLVTEGDPVVMSAALPREAREVEETMRDK